MKRTLSDFPYQLDVIPGEYGEYFVQYPELPGCMTQVRRLEDVPAIAREILIGRLEIALEDGIDIPLPHERLEETAPSGSSIHECRSKQGRSDAEVEQEPRADAVELLVHCRKRALDSPPAR